MPRKRDSFDRMLEYQTRHAGWIIFRSIFWAMYLLIIGGVLIFYSMADVSVSLQFFFGLALSMLAIMMIFYGAAETLHHKLMRKYA